MNTVDQLRRDISTLVNYSAVREREYTRRRDEIAAVLKDKRKGLVELRSITAEVLVPPVMRDSALVRSLWSRLMRRKATRLRDKANSIEEDVRRLIASGRAAEQSRKTLAGVGRQLKRAEGEIADLDHPPQEIVAALSAVSAKIASLARKMDAQAVVDAARAIIACIDGWSKAGRLSRKVASGGENAGRIWLPIPFSMRSQAVALGAKQDLSVKGVSRFYVELGEPLARFNALLPHAFRETRPNLKFSTIRSTAQRQNLWSFMDQLSWDHIRNVNYSMTGKRCILCGKQSGNFVRKLEPEKPNKVGTVECHEVWNFSKPDPDIPVGIQRLERIMVVCFDCHMCFHDEIARGKALRIGEEDLERQVQRYLVRRRSFLTHKSPKQLAVEMQAEHARLADHKDVSTWIVDLSKLAKQDYMYGQTPTLLFNNPAGVKASQLAGITFKDEAGTVHPAVNPERLYQQIAMKWIRQPEPTYQVVGRR